MTPTLDREGMGAAAGTSLSMAKKEQPGRPIPKWTKEGGLILL